MLKIGNIKVQSQWYLAVVILIVAVYGSFLGQRDIPMANQEIVLQFADEHISFNETQHTIGIVKKELTRIGVSNIQVGKQEDGRLVISYYSDSNAESIKELLSTQPEIALGFNGSEAQPQPFELPTKEPLSGYNLDVFEIQDGQTSYSRLGDQCALELKSSQTRFLNPNFYIICQETVLLDGRENLGVEFCFQRYIALAKDYRSHKIPEVRAGPLC